MSAVAEMVEVRSARMSAHCDEKSIIATAGDGGDDSAEFKVSQWEGVAKVLGSSNAGTI